MPKITGNVFVRGVDAGAMLALAKERLALLADADWTITEAHFHSDDGPMVSEVATRDGMLPMWGGNVVAEAEVKEG